MKTEFDIDQIVYLIADDEPIKGVVTRIIISKEEKNYYEIRDLATGLYVAAYEDNIFSSMSKLWINEVFVKTGIFDDNKI